MAEYEKWLKNRKLPSEDSTDDNISEYNRDYSLCWTDEFTLEDSSST